MIRNRLLLVMIVLFSLLGAGVFGAFGVSAVQPPPDGEKVYLPLLLHSWPIPTPTPTPTATPSPTPSPTPIPTPASCPLDNVTGVYLVQTSNTQHNCPLPINDMEGEGTVIQTGDQLVLVFQDIATTGTINTTTGEFMVSADTTSATLSATGVFGLGQNPMTVTGHAQLQLRLGPATCIANFDLNGERQSCQTKASTSRQMRLLPFTDKGEAQ
ncbi:MAG: hypothetical protein J5I90_20705 [Caldilineales bacterium]|nr:hypothetical protein [Caldilineales bacterium]